MGLPENQNTRPQVVSIDTQKNRRIVRIPVSSLGDNMIVVKHTKPFQVIQFLWRKADYSVIQVGDTSTSSMELLQARIPTGHNIVDVIPLNPSELFNNYFSVYDAADYPGEKMTAGEFNRGVAHYYVEFSDSSVLTPEIVPRYAHVIELADNEHGAS